MKARSKPKPPISVTVEGRVENTANAVTYISVTWPAPPTGGQPVAEIDLYRNSVLLATLDPSAVSYSDATALSGVDYSYGVQVVSVNGVSSSRRGSILVRKPSPPVWSGAPTGLTLTQGQTYDFTQHAADVDGTSFTFSLTSGPTGSSVTNGVFTMGSASGNAVIRVTDPTGLYDEHTCTMTVSVVDSFLSAVRVFEEPYPSPTIAFPSQWRDYALMRPRLSNLQYPDVLPTDLNSFTISVGCDVYVWTIAALSAAKISDGWTLQSDTVTDSMGNVYKLYKKTCPAGTVTTWGANGLDTTNGDIVNLPPLYMVPRTNGSGVGVTISNSPVPYPWQRLGGGTVNADKDVLYWDPRYWDDVSISAPSTSVITVAWAGSSAATITAIEASFNSAPAGSVIVYTNTNPLTGTLTLTTGGTWPLPKKLYVSNPEAIALTGAGRVSIVGDHIMVIGWASDATTVSGGTKYAGAVFVTQRGADWSGFYHCAVYNQVQASISGSQHAAFVLGGRVTAVMRCFVDTRMNNSTGSSVTERDGIWCEGNKYTDTGVYIPAPIVRRTWMRGNATQLTTDADSQTPFQTGDKNGYDTWLPELNATVEYGQHWTAALMYRSLIHETQAGIEITTNKHSGNSFIQNRIRHVPGQHGNRNGYYHCHIGEWIDAGGTAVKTFHKRAGYRFATKFSLMLNCYLSGMRVISDGTYQVRGGGNRAITFHCGNRKSVTESIGCYIEVQDMIVANLTITDTDQTVIMYNQEGSVDQNNPITNYVGKNKRIHILNSVFDAPTESLIDYSTTANMPAPVAPDSTNKMSNNLAQYNSIGSPGNIVGEPTVSEVPDWSAGADGLYRPTAGQNLNRGKALTVTLPDMLGTKRTTYIGALEPGSTASFPVGLSFGASGNIGPATNLVIGFA